MKGSNGLTLLEVVIAVAILAVGVLAAAMLQASSLRATRAAQDLQSINLVARSQIDSWRGSQLTQTTAETFDCSTGALTCEVVVRPCTLAGGGLTCTLATVVDPPAHAVLVTVASAERSLVLETVVSK